MQRKQMRDVPMAWADGAFSGFRARGGVEVDLTWSGGRATGATLRPTLNGTHRIRMSGGQRVRSISADGAEVPFRPDGNETIVTLATGKRYELAFP